MFLNFHNMVQSFRKWDDSGRIISLKIHKLEKNHYSFKGHYLDGIDNINMMVKPICEGSDTTMCLGLKDLNLFW